MNSALFFLIVFSCSLVSPQIVHSEQRLSETATCQSFQIKISVSECRLWLFEKNDGKLKLVNVYEVGTAKAGLKVYPMGLGHITAIEFDPSWYPIARSRKAFAKRGIKLPAVVPPKSKLNYMGEFKISLSHSVPVYGSIYRIHGIRPGDESCIGKRVSGGCIRMQNKEGVKLARTVSVGTPVEIVP
jgi:lipoprotein-anchoring transpeptidase ErfK/SrfK